MSAAQILAKVSTMGLTDAQKLGLVQKYATDKANYSNVTSIQALSASQKGAIFSTTSLSAAFKGLWATMVANPWIWVVAGISAAVGAVNMYKKSQTELAQSTQEAANTFKDQSSSVDEYVSRYKELREQLLAAIGDEEKTASVKKDLLALQTELNDKFGDEYGRLNLVTEAYRDQTDAIKNLNKEAAKQYLNENGKGIKQAKDKMTTPDIYDLSRNTLSDSKKGSQELKDIIAKYEDKGIHTTDTSSITGSNTYAIKITANPADAKQTINDFMSDVRDKAKELGDEHLFDGIIKVSESSLNDAKDTISKYGDQFHEGLMAEIASDDSKSIQFNDLLDVVEEYNKAVAEAEDPFDNDKVDEAHEKYVQLKADIQGNSEEWGKYKYITDDIFNSVDDNLYKLAKGISSETSLSKLKEQLDGLKKTDLSAIVDSKDGDTYQFLADAAEKYKVKIEDVINALVRLGVVKDDTESKAANPIVPKTYGDTVKELNGMKDAFTALQKAYGDFTDKDKSISFDDLSGMMDKFENVEGIDNYIKRIQEANGEVSTTQQVFNELTDAYIKQTGILDDVNDGNASLIQSFLEQQGVVNASQIVMEAYNEQKKLSQIEDFNTVASTYETVNAFLEQGNATDEAKNALMRYYLEKQTANGITLTVDGDIKNIETLVSKLGGAVSAFQAFYKARQGIINTHQADMKAEFDKNKKNPSILTTNPITQASNLQKQKDEIQAEFDKYQNEMQAAVDGVLNKTSAQVSNSPGSGKKSGGGKKGGSKDKSQIEDWINREIEMLKKKRAELVDAASDTYLSYFGISEKEFERAKEILSNATPSESDLNELQMLAEKTGMSLSSLYEQIYSGKWEQSRQGSISDALMYDHKIIEEYGKAIELYQAEYEKAIAKVPEYKDKIENGDMSIDTISGNEATAVQDAIKAYDKLAENIKGQKEAEKKYIEDIGKKYEIPIKELEKENDKIKESNSLLQKQMDYAKAKGEVVNSSFYESMISNNKKLEKNQRELIKKKKSYMADLMTTDGFSVDSEEYQTLANEIYSAKSELLQLEIEQEEYNNKLLQMPVDNMDTIISMYKNIGDAISNWGAEYEASGKKLDAKYYQKMISNGATLIDQYREQSYLIKDVMDEYEVGSDNWNQMYSRLQSCNSEMSSMVQNMAQWNEQLLQMPIDNINELTSSLNKVLDGLNAVKGEHDTTIAAVTGAIAEQIKLLNEQKEVQNKEFNSSKQVLQDRLKLLQDQNKELQLQTAYEKSLYNLQLVNSQYTEATIRNGQKVYEQNTDKLRDAQESLKDAEFNLETNKIQKQIDEITESNEKFNSAIEERIELLNKESEKWSEIVTKTEQANKESTTDSILGSGWKDKVLSGNDSNIYEMFKQQYQTNTEQIKKYEEQINSTENISKLLDDYIASYKEGNLTYEQAQAGIKDLLSQINQKMSASDNLQNIYDYLGATNNTDANADAVLKGIQDGFSTSADELVKSLEQYNKNSGMISEYTSSWQQLTVDISNMLEVLKDVRNSLKNSEDNDDDDNKKSKKKKKKTKWDSSGGDVATGPGMEIHHTGLASGVAGNGNTAENTNKLKELGVRRLKPNEVVSILEKGESILNKENIANILSNFNAVSMLKTPEVPDYSNIIQKQNSQTNVNVQMGDISLPNVKNGEDFVREFANSAITSLEQSFSKIFNQ